MTEPRIPDPRDDDPEDVSDKLSIASAMWSRGDRADALSWLRRAAESASDADADLRALELAKAASILADHAAAPPPPPVPSAAPPAPPARPAPAPSVSPPRAPAVVAPSSRPAGPPRVSVSPQAVPVKSAPMAAPRPGGTSRPPGSKLGPLPPMRPLGTAPTRPVAVTAPRAPSTSVVSSVTGENSTSGSIPREEAQRREASAPMPWDEPDEETRQIAVAPSEASPYDHESAGTSDLLLDGDETTTSAPAVELPSPFSPAAAEPVTAEPVAQAYAAPVELPLAVGVRVRLLVDGGRVIAEPDRGQPGLLAILSPALAEDDIRTVFQR